MAKWIKIDGKDEWFNVDAAIRIKPMEHTTPYLRIWTDKDHSVDLSGADGRAVCAYLKTQGVDIDLGEYAMKESGPAKVIRQR